MSIVNTSLRCKRFHTSYQVSHVRKAKKDRIVVLESELQVLDVFLVGATGVLR